MSHTDLPPSACCEIFDFILIYVNIDKINGFLSKFPFKI